MINLQDFVERLRNVQTIVHNSQSQAASQSAAIVIGTIADDLENGRVDIEDALTDLKQACSAFNPTKPSGA